jgi:hypothetical protein
MGQMLQFHSLLDAAATAVTTVHSQLGGDDADAVLLLLLLPPVCCVMLMVQAHQLLLQGLNGRCVFRQASHAASLFCQSRPFIRRPPQHVFGATQHIKQHTIIAKQPLQRFHHGRRCSFWLQRQRKSGPSAAAATANPRHSCAGVGE